MTPSLKQIGAAFDASPRHYWIFGIFLCLIGAGLLLSPDDNWSVIGLSAAYVVAVVVFGISLWKRAKTISCILIFAILFNPPQIQAQESPRDGGTGGAAICVRVVIGLFVLVFGSVAGCKTYSFCQRKFPKDDPGSTNAPPTDFQFAGVGGGDSDSDSYAAALNFGEAGSCPQECLGGDGGASGDITTTFKFSFQVDGTDTNGAAILTHIQMSARRGPDSWQDWAGFKDDARRMGVTTTGHSGDFSFARNGHPIDRASSPIGWDEVRQIATFGIGTPRCILFVERSEDLRHWAPVLSADVLQGMTIGIEDSQPTSAMFYRVRGIRD